MGTSVSRAIQAHARTILAALAAFALTLGLAPLAFATEDSVAASFVLAASEGSGEAATPNPAASIESEGVTLASALAGTSTSIVSADVVLDSADLIVGSFTADGLTFAVGPDGLTLVAVAPDAVSDGAIAIPSSVSYDDATYPVTAIGSYAFYLSGATDVALPASVASVDCRAFRSSDVERVEVAAGNPNIASFDGCLYDSQLSSLLLIPEGRAGAVLLPKQAEVVQASKFSHCSLVDAISVEEGGADFASWDGLLYDASGTTLLRVPAGATDITIRDGCTAIADGALEGCAKLERINAPASVTSLSPDVFTSIPTVSLPAQMAVQDGTNPGVASGLTDQVNESADSSSQVESVAGPLAGPGYEGDARSASADSPAEGEAATQSSSQDEVSSGVASSLLDQANASTNFAPQLTAMVALSSTDDDLPEVDSTAIAVYLNEGAGDQAWILRGFKTIVQTESGEEASSQAATVYAATYGSYTVYGNGGTLTCEDSNGPVHWSGPNLFDTSYSPQKLISVSGDLLYYRDAYLCSHTIYTRVKVSRVGYSHAGWRGTWNWSMGQSEVDSSYTGSFVETALWNPNHYTIAFECGEGEAADIADIVATYDQDIMLPAPEERQGYRFLGWNTAADGSGTMHQPGAVRNLTAEDGATVTLFAQWQPCIIDFDTDSEPGDVDYPGAPKDPIYMPDAEVGPDGTIEIEDPKRPGYVFEGWVIPNAGGTEAVDQELVYQGDDGKWYVDASKLPDYAGDDGRVELTARWTSVISVDVPSSVTFYADLVTQGQESREGTADGAFGQSKVANQSQVDLRVVGLESSAVKTEGSTLGADSILKKADAATPSSSTQKLLSLYPSTKQWKPEDLQNPDAVGGDKDAAAVDFDLDDILLEKSFAADDFTIAAGDTLNMGYRLNLAETGQQLDYDKLSTLSEGQSASIANVSYCFAADALPSDWGEPLWIENPDRTSNPAKYLLLKDIKAAADDLSANGTASQYYATYKGLLDKQVMTNGNPGVGPYFQLKVDGHYLPLQLIGICQDTKSDGTGKAGLTFQMRDIYAFKDTRSAAAGGGTFDTRMHPANINSGGWASAPMRTTLQSTFWNLLSAETRSAIAPVDKFQQLPGGTDASKLDKSTDETVWLPSVYEVYGARLDNYNESEALAVNGNVPFQYMAYRGNAGSTTNTRAVKTYNGSANVWWLRSAYRSSTTAFCLVHPNGFRGQAGGTYGVAPAFCL